MENFDGEVWKDVPGYEGYYQASTHGRIRSMDREITHSNGKVQNVHGKVLSPAKINTNYLTLFLCKNKFHKSFLVHRVIAMTFLENPSNKRCINHKDGNKQNNFSNNLEWCDHRENMKHSFDILGYKSGTYGKRGKEVHQSMPVLCFDTDMNFICEYESLTDAMFNTKEDRHKIMKNCKGEIKTCGNYIFKLKDYKYKRTWNKGRKIIFQTSE